MPSLEQLLPLEPIPRVRIDSRRKPSDNDERNDCCADPPDFEYDSGHEQQQASGEEEHAGLRNPPEELRRPPAKDLSTIDVTSPPTGEWRPFELW
jgi:hypothetical protein